MKTYKDELIKSMNYLAEKPNTIFVGQQTAYAGNPMSTTILDVSKDKMIETPVFEEVQMGMSTGMALNGIVPICCFPRFDFMLRCMDSLVNHLDKMQTMTEGTFKPKVIMRTSIGSTNPLDGGVQHTQDYTMSFKSMLHEVDVVLLEEPDNIFTEFQSAYNGDRSTLLVEYGDYYNEK